MAGRLVAVWVEKTAAPKVSYWAAQWAGLSAVRRAAPMVQKRAAQTAENWVAYSVLWKVAQLAVPRAVRREGCSAVQMAGMWAA